MLAAFPKSEARIFPGKLNVIEHNFFVPKDHAEPTAGTLRIFARSVTRHEVARDSVAEPSTIGHTSEKSWIIYLQGGPGKGCAQPQSFALTNILIVRGYQVLYVDQRGTSLSTPVTAATLQLPGDVEAQADYLKLFRADSIIRDCEVIRLVLTKDYPADLKKWSVWGQRFGGYCAMTYLSFYLEALRAVFITAGTPALGQHPVDVYASLFVNDAYTDFGLSQSALAKIRNVKQYITNTMFHNAIRYRTREIAEALFLLRDDVKD